MEANIVQLTNQPIPQMPLQEGIGPIYIIQIIEVVHNGPRTTMTTKTYNHSRYFLTKGEAEEEVKALSFSTALDSPSIAETKYFIQTLWPHGITPKFEVVGGNTSYNVN